MKTAVHSKWKLFFAWQDQEQENWLAEMSQKGWHLHEVRAFGKFIFREGKKRACTYRLDYSQEAQPEDYIQLFRDAGWEHIGVRNGWHYWRKEKDAGKPSELFSDPRSKITKYERVFRANTAWAPAMSALYILGAAMHKQFPGQQPWWVLIPFMSVCFLGVVYAVLNGIKIMQRINQLKRGQVAR